MSFFQALSFIRWALQTPWLPPGSAQVTQTEALAFTLRSLKTCLSSASAQLRLPEDSRRLQGHHKLSSAQLYSRDDTIEALWLQRQLSTAARPISWFSRPSKTCYAKPAPPAWVKCYTWAVTSKTHVQCGWGTFHSCVAWAKKALHALRWQNVRPESLYAKARGRSARPHAVALQDAFVSSVYCMACVTFARDAQRG